MRMLKYVAPAVLVLGLAAGLALVRADEPPKYTTKQVMDMAHKDNKDTGELALYSKLKKSTDADIYRVTGLHGTAIAQLFANSSSAALKTLNPQMRAFFVAAGLSPADAKILTSS